MLSTLLLIKILLLHRALTEVPPASAKASQGKLTSRASENISASKAADGAVTSILKRGGTSLTSTAAGIGSVGATASQAGSSISAASAGRGKASTSLKRRRRVGKRQLPVKVVLSMGNKNDSVLPGQLFLPGFNPLRLLKLPDISDKPRRKRAKGTGNIQLIDPEDTARAVAYPPDHTPLPVSHAAGGQVGVSLRSGPTAVSSLLTAVENSFQSLVLGSISASAPGVSTAVSMGRLRGPGGESRKQQMAVGTPPPGSRGSALKK